MSSVSESRYTDLLDEIRHEFPDFHLIRKDFSPLSRVIDRALRVLTFGAQRCYLTHYQTTIGATVYVTPDWDALSPEQRYVTMRHERIHLRQFRRYTLAGMAFLYLFVPLPAGLAWFRAHFEKQAYAETIRAAAEVHGINHVKAAGFRSYVVEQFTGGAYGWMWPFRDGIERWYDAVVNSVEKGISR